MPPLGGESVVPCARHHPAGRVSACPPPRLAQTHAAMGVSAAAGRTSESVLSYLEGQLSNDTLTRRPDSSSATTVATAYTWLCSNHRERPAMAERHCTHLQPCIVICRLELHARQQSRPVKGERRRRGTGNALPKRPDPQHLPLRACGSPCLCSLHREWNM